MRAAALPTLALIVAGCRAPSSRGDTQPTEVAASASADAPAPAASSSAPAPPPLVPPTPITMACCTMDLAEGKFGVKGVTTRYSGDYLRRKDGERLLFPQDLINDTKELFQHAKSAGQPVTQTRRVRPIGEGPRFVSVELEDHGETGALLPFVHSSCKTIDLRTGRALKLDEVVAKEVAARAIADGEKRFGELAGHEDYRFLASSFAVVGENGARVRFCNPRRREELAAARMDVEVALR